MEHSEYVVFATEWPLLMQLCEMIHPCYEVIRKQEEFNGKNLLRFIIRILMGTLSSVCLAEMQ